MALTKTPYEVLVRFNPDGSVSGTHIKFLETYVDDATGTVLLQREGQAEHVSMAGERGFPIANVLDAIHTGALSTIDALNAATAAKDAEAAQLQATIAAKDAEIEALKGGAA